MIILKNHGVKRNRNKEGYVSIKDTVFGDLLRKNSDHRYLDKTTSLSISIINIYILFLTKLQK